MKISDNIIKLSGFGIYVTYVDNKLWACNMIPKSGHPELDPDGCISWEEMIDPINDELLQIINKELGLQLKKLC